MDNNECEPAWRVVLTCCGRSDGFLMARTWEDADRIRENYTSGPGVHPNGYSAPEREPGHKRSAIVESAALAVSPRPLTEPLIAQIEKLRQDEPYGYGTTDRDAHKWEGHTRAIDEVLALLSAAPHPLVSPSEPPGWRDMASAPLDNTLVRLLVKFDNHGIEDAYAPTATIGHCCDGEWNFVGWDWHRDEWTRGSGDLLGWLPMVGPASLSPAPSITPSRS